MNEINDDFNYLKRVSDLTISTFLQYNRKRNAVPCCKQEKYPFEK